MAGAWHLGAPGGRVRAETQVHWVARVQAGAGLGLTLEPRRIPAGVGSDCGENSQRELGGVGICASCKAAPLPAI